MKRTLMKVLISLVFLTLLTNCATIVKTPRQDIFIVSQPEQAKVVVYDSNNYMVWNGETPSNITLGKGNGYFKGATYRVEISKPGFQTMTVYLKSSVTGWYIGGNILLGGLVGWLVVDPVTGAMWVLNPKNLSIQLSKYDSLTGDNSGLKVIMLSEIDPEIIKDKSTQRVN